MKRLFGLRILIVITLALGINYVVWRWLFSVNWSSWWIAVPLVVVETYSLIDCMLFGLTMWKLKERPEPEPAPADVTVDVFITTYNEPIEMVMNTSMSAKAITYPHRTWVLDDGNRPEMEAATKVAGIGYISRSAEWIGHSRHAKAGNLNNALGATDGEFILILDADQVPKPNILDRTLGYFQDPEVALVQTQQFFINVPTADPLGSQAPLFYGPIQQGKDGWNAAFFCGSNAVLRREAMMQMGVRGYVKEVEQSIRKALGAADQVLTKARKRGAVTPGEATALNRVASAVGLATQQLARGELLAEITFDFQVAVDDATREVVAADLAELVADLTEIDRLSGSSGRHHAVLVDDAALAALARRDWSPLGALESVRALVKTIDVDRFDEAQPVMPMATISVTEDMATAMRLHSHGWKTVYHHESLADGLAPEDLNTMLTQRLRWAQGTMQVMLRENPLTQKGLSAPQRLMYFATMWSYLSGFAALVYIIAPIVYLCFGVLPVRAFSFDFFIRLVPFLLCNQLLFVVIAKGIRTWRGMQYSLALFPVWIKAFTTAFANVYFGKSLSFAVTLKTKPEWSPQWGLVRPQLIAMAALFIACVVGALRMFSGHAAVSSTLINIAWVVFDELLLGAVITAARYRGFVAPESSAKGVSV